MYKAHVSCRSSTARVKETSARQCSGKQCEVSFCSVATDFAILSTQSTVGAAASYTAHGEQL